MKHWLKPTTPTGLLLIVLVMFGFGFMLVPLYDVFCEVTGLNGKTAGQYQGNLEIEAQQRTVTIQFIGNRNSDLPWDFRPEQEELTLHPGERKQTYFHVSNTYDRPVVAQAIPSVAPARAADYLNKIECFCFHQQPLEAGESKNLPLVFFIDPDMPEDISKLTLSYTLFDISEDQSAQAQ